MSPPPEGSAGRFRRLDLLAIGNAGIFLAALALLATALARSPSAPLLAALALLFACGAAGLVLRHRFWSALADELQRRKQAEQEARAAERVKGELLANVSHEMRTPMHGVLGMADLLLRGGLAPAQREQVEVIRTSSEALLALVDDILDLSRLEAGRRLRLRRRSFDLREVVGEVERLLGPQARGRGIALAVRVAPELPGRQEGDPVRLRQVLLNLVGNAIRHTRRGWVTVGIDRVGAAGAPAAFRCAVRDTGVGIRPEVQARLFQPYAQSDGSDGSATREPAGTGLGLFISKSIVEQMGGRIGFESARGEGSTFWFEAPLVPAVGGQAAERREEEGEAARQVRRGWRVLVVDDHPVNRRVALAQLASLGYAAAGAEDGEAALAALAREPPYDAVLLDCAMPRLDGYETCRRWRAREADGRRAVVVALTAHAGPGERERCLAAGMDDVLTKPAQSDELAAVLDRWLHGGVAAGPAPRASPQAAADGLDERAAADRWDERFQADGLDEILAMDALEERLQALDRLGVATGEEVRRQVVEEFLRQGSEDMAVLREALSRRDGAALAAASHSLAGSAAILGAAALAAGCAALEGAAAQLAGPEGRAAGAARLAAVEASYRALAARLADRLTA